MSVIVDAVSEVLDIRTDQMGPPPEFGSACDTEFILAMAKAEDSVKILIDISRALSSEELSSVGSIG